MCSATIFSSSFVAGKIVVVNPLSAAMSLAHDVSGLGSTRVVRFGVSVGRDPMSRTTLLQERRMQTFQNVLGHWQARRLSALEAAEMLGMSERSFRRYRRRYEDDGLDGLVEGSTRRPRAACRPTGSNGCSSSTEPAIRAGRSSTSMTISAPTMASPGATPGPRPPCSAQAWCPRHPGAAPTVAGARASPASA